MQPKIYINTDARTARASLTGIEVAKASCQLLSEWQLAVYFHAPGEQPAEFAGAADIVLSLKPTDDPEAAVLIYSDAPVFDEELACYLFDFVSVDSEDLRALIGKQTEIAVTAEVAWTIESRRRRAKWQTTVVNAYNRPDDAAPDPVASASNAWLTARAVRFDLAQTLTIEQKSQARTNIGVTSGVTDHGALSGLADDDHPHYLNQARGDARYPLASAMTTALAGKEPVREAATLAELEAGLLTVVKSLTPELFKAAVLAIAPGGTSLDLPVSIASGGTGSENAAAARVALGIVESVAAVAQQTSITISGDASTDWNNNGYIDIAEPGGVVRIWFNVDGTGSAPASDTERLIMIELTSGDPGATVVEVIAAALIADGAFTVTFNSTQVLLTAITAGQVGRPTTTTNTSIGSPNIDVAGADQYFRLVAANGEQLTDVDAATLQGLPAAEFARFNHTHAFSSLTTRPRFAATNADATSTTTALATLGGTSGGGLRVAVTAGTWIFEATGLLLTSATTEGLSLAVNGPTASLVQAHITIPSNGIGGNVNGTVSAWETKVSNTIGPGASTRGRWHVSGRFVATASGNFDIRYSAETGGGASVTIPAGAILAVYPAV